jgi:hypothetical protein
MHCFVSFADTLLKKYYDFEVVSKAPKAAEVDRESCQSMETEGMRIMVEKWKNSNLADLKMCSFVHDKDCRALFLLETLN